MEYHTVEEDRGREGSLLRANSRLEDAAITLTLSLTLTLIGLKDAAMWRYRDSCDAADGEM